MHITLYRKYRPSTFDEIAGENDIITTIKNSLQKNIMAHAYLFIGPRGVGKTTTARLIAKGLNCLINGVTGTPCNACENCIDITQNKFIDLIEIDAASNRGIDEIRDLKNRINYLPVKGRKKVYIIDEVHMLTKEAFNALLKTLEEPPSHVIFILATTEADKVLDTIKSRCQRYDFKFLDSIDLKNKLMMIAKSEEVEIDDESLKLIYEISGGSMRDAISILEKLISFCYNEKITISKTEKILDVIPEVKLSEFLEILTKDEISKGVEFLDELWNSSVNVEDFFKKFAYYLKKILLEKKSPFTVEKSLFIIEIIFEIMGKFKYEEDKRIIGYIILHKISNSNLNNLNLSQKSNTIDLNETSKIKQEVEQELELETHNTKTVEKSEQEKTVKKEYQKEDEIKSKIEDVKKSWNEIVNEAKKQKLPLISFLTRAVPVNIKDGILHIDFSEENKFHKESMEKPYYNDIFLEVLQNKLGEKIRVQYNIIENKNNNIEEKSDLVTTIVDFFDGELI